MSTTLWRKCATPDCQAHALHVDQEESFCLECLVGRLGGVAERTLSRLRAEHLGGKYPTAPDAYSLEPKRISPGPTPAAAAHRPIGTKRPYTMTEEGRAARAEWGRKGAAARSASLRKRRADLSDLAREIYTGEEFSQ